MTAKTITACLVIIGNEILSGRTKDANLAYLGERLNELGIRLMEARVIPDIEARIVETLNEVRPAYDYVFTTGGIGPTHDDITAQSVAKAFGVPLIEHPQARAILEAHYPTGQLTPGRLLMARTPEGAELIENSLSAAPGFRIGNVHVLAGIPAVMQAMLEGLGPSLRGGARLDSLSLTVRVPESVLSAGLGALQARYEDVEIGSYPFVREGRFGVNIVLRSIDSERLETAYREAQELARELGDDSV